MRDRDTVERAEDDGVVPLTRRTKEGVPYTRPVDVEQQIGETLALSPSMLVLQARIRDRNDPKYLHDECLVYFLREYRQQGSKEIVNELSKVLLERWGETIEKKLLGLGQQFVHEAYSEVVERLFSLIFDLGSDRGDHLQIRFAAVLKRIRIDVYRKYRPLADHAGDTEGEDEGLTMDLVDPTPTPEQYVLDNERAREGAEAVASLPEPIRTAYMLRHYEDWPIEDKDSTVMTISRYFRKDPRTIRNWLTKAERLLRERRGAQR